MADTLSAPGVESRLAEALDHVQSALRLAEADEWERAAEYDALCRQVVESLTTDVAEADVQTLIDGLAAVRVHYGRLLAMAEARRDRLAQEVRDSKRGKAGVLAYEANL